MSRAVQMVTDQDSTLLDDAIVPTGHSQSERFHATDECQSLQGATTRDASINEIHDQGLWPCRNCHDEWWVALPTGANRARPRYHTSPCSGFKHLDRVKWTTRNQVKSMDICECRKCGDGGRDPQEQGHDRPCPVCGSDDFEQLPSHLRYDCTGGDD